MLYKKGDIVQVWSLQSFYQGGFLNGVEGIVYQDQMLGGSVLVTVERDFDGKTKIDPNYEVYAEQLKLVHRFSEKEEAYEIVKRLEKILDECKIKLIKALKE